MKKENPRIVTISPEGSRLKVECHIYETQKAMLVAARRFTRSMYHNLTNGTYAYCEGTISLMPTPQHLAVIFFNRQHWSYGIIAHEFDHAANCLMYRRGYRSLKVSIDEATPEEEEHCYILQSLIDRFFEKYGL